MVIKRKEVQWWEPGWAHYPRVYTAFRRVYSFWPLFRIVLLSGVVVAIAALVLQKKFPELEFDWMKAMATSIAVGFLIPAVVYLVALIPRHISVRRKGIFIVVQGILIFLKSSDINDICIEEEGQRRWLLTFNARGREYAIGIPDERAITAIADIIEKFWKTDVRVVSNGTTSDCTATR